MAVNTPIIEDSGLFFITFTCQDWLHLFKITNSDDVIYKWFDYLNSKGQKIKAYVVMPNHLHVIIEFNKTQSINTVISNGIRFMAYEIVKRLKEQNHDDILSKLSAAVSKSDEKRGKLHQVFESSFDCKPITNSYFFEQKLNYIHNNPCSGKWKLVDSPVDYLQSSARYYLTGQQGAYEIEE